MTEWSKKKYNEYYNSYVPWMEDKYLAWFGDNKVSYTAKQELDKTKVTGIDQVDQAQDGVNNLVGGQLGSKGLGGGATDKISKEGVNRAEVGDTGPVNADEAKKAQTQGKTWGESFKTAGGLLGGGSGGKEEKK